MRLWDVATGQQIRPAMICTPETATLVPEWSQIERAPPD
jgi:hypothetical protein